MKISGKQKQRGSALLLTLGILSLVLILAMSFAFTARTNRQVAKINADQIKAKLLAESGLNRVLAAMKNNFNDVISDQNNIYPPTKNGVWRFIGTDQKFIASTGVENYTFNDEKILPCLKNINKTAEFQSIVINLGGGNTETIGRIAFLIVEEANKLDVNQILSLRKEADNRPFIVFDGTEFGISTAGLYDKFSNSRGDFLFDISGTELTSIELKEDNTIRLGLHMQELRATKSDYLKKLPEGFPGLQSPSPIEMAATLTPWFSYSHLVNELDSNFEEGCYTFFSGEDIEAYWDEDDEVERQRFDVTGYEWNGWDVADKNDLVEKLVADEKRSEFFVDKDKRTDLKPSPNLGDPGFGLPYLYQLKQDTPDFGKQVAANMIDFCDADNAATYSTNFDFNDPSPDGPEQPNYCGNEAVAYFNEISLKFIGYKSDTPANKFEIKILPFIELLNIYPIKVPEAKYQLKIYLEVFWDDDIDASINLCHDVDFGEIAEFSIGYELLTFSAEELIGEIISTDEEKKCSVIVKKIVAVSILDGDSIADIGFWQDEDGIKMDMLIDDIAFTPSQFATWEVDDPRLNHLSDRWTPSYFKDDDDIFSHKAKNSCFPDSVTGNMDAEEYSDIDFSDPDKTFSTAFIPNRPFRSLWELGAIHRGEPYRTIDIADIDKEILDQVKIGPLKKTKGKFNLYSNNPATVKVLLSNIDVETFYDDVNKDETATVTTAPSPLSPAPSFSRGVFAEILEYTDGNNDREREALIGRTANLLTTRMDKYSILVVAQSLQELEGVTSANWSAAQQTAINPIAYNGGYYSILATQRLLAHVVRNAWHNEYKIIQMQLLED